jgi:hypothetical protein
MAELTPHQRQALGVFKMARDMRHQHLDREARRARGPQAASIRDSMTADDHFIDGCEAVLRFERGRIKEPDGTVHEVTFDRADAESIGAKMAELRAALPADKHALWDEVFGPPV